MQTTKDNNNLEAENLAWECFQKTGNIGYYLLHKNLCENGEC